MILIFNKGNNKTKVVNEIQKKINLYKNTGATYVIYCFDTDKYDTDPYENKILCDEEKYCKSKGYEFVWFCHNIEEVFWGESVERNDKKKKAIQYMTKHKIDTLSKNNLTVDKMTKGKSNILNVLNKYLTGE